MIGNRNFVFLTVYRTLQSIGENEYGKTGHSNNFYFFEALHDHFEAQFCLGLQYYTTLQTLITRRAVHVRFNIVKQCL